jgi:hypothetical protein
VLGALGIQAEIVDLNEDDEEICSISNFVDNLEEME